MPDVVQLHCCVCGHGSTRPLADWVNKTTITGVGPVVACDSHNEEEFKAAVEKFYPPARTPNSPVKK